MFASFNCAQCEVTCRQCNTSVGKNAKPTANPRAPQGPGLYCNACRFPPCEHKRQRHTTECTEQNEFVPFRCQECIAENADPRCKLCGKHEACELQRVLSAAAPEGPGLYCLDCRYPACRHGERWRSERGKRMFASFNCAQCEVTYRQCNTSVGKNAKPTANPRAPQGHGLYCSACRFPPCKHNTPG